MRGELLLCRNSELRTELMDPARQAARVHNSSRNRPEPTSAQMNKAGFLQRFGAAEAAA